MSEKYSLWLRPIQNQIDEYGLIISQLAHEYDSVPFPPHITLISGLSDDLNRLIKVCEKIVTSTKKFNIPCKKISYADEFYRNLFILTDLDSNLDQLYEKSLQELSYTPKEKFLPHVSLYYGNLNLNIKEKIAKDLENSYPKVFNLERLDIYEHSGEIIEWYLVESFHFK